MGFFYSQIYLQYTHHHYVDNWLTNFVKMNPNRSSYAFGLNRQRPGFFDLSFLANIDSPVQTWVGVNCSSPA